MPEKVVLVVPAYNEGKTIKEVISDSLNVKSINEIIVIDDGSGDDTYSQALLFGNSLDNVFVLRHKVNLGKGAALKTGCLAAVRRGADIIITIDGDGQHPVEHAPAMVEKLKAENLAAVFSVRQGGDKMPIIRYIGNKILNGVAYALFRINLKDMWCGFRAIRAVYLPHIDWQSNDYSGEIQMALKIGKKRLPYGEHTIPAVYNDTAKGVTIINGLKLLGQMVIWRIKL